jgi:deoxycytidylate deaminase
MTTTFTLDWSDLAFGNKKSVDALNAFFIAAPREMTSARFTQIVKEYLPQGNIVLGLAKEPYVLGFEDQPQFRTFTPRSLGGVGQKIIDKVNASPSKHKIYTLSYFQREAKYVYEKLTFRKVLLVNGSWKYAFHTQENYYTLVNRKAVYEMISPFTDEAEAKEYEKRVTKELATLIPKKSKTKTYTEQEMLALAAQVARLSFDYTFQTGAVIGKKIKGGKGYTLLTYGFNKVIPYQTHAMHHGASREKHFSPPNDLNHYDTVHAEIDAIIRAGKEKVDLAGATLFVNLMPCPTCSRAIAETGIAEVIYGLDHSVGYAVDLLQSAGKIVKSQKSL